MYKIYKIVDNTNGNVYVGQTKKKKLSDRISCHKHSYKCEDRYYSSHEILKNNDWYYELIQETDDKSREKYWINNTPNCINKNKCNFDMKKYQKEWRKNNKEYRKKYNKEYQKKRIYNPDKIKETRKYKNSWGGDPRFYNNLLKIDINLFN